MECIGACLDKNPSSITPKLKIPSLYKPEDCQGVRFGKFAVESTQGSFRAKFNTSIVPSGGLRVRRNAQLDSEQVGSLVYAKENGTF